MLEIVDVPVHGRKTGYMSDDTATYKNGSFVVASGTFSAADITTLGTASSNKPGFAVAGYPKLVRAWGTNGGRAWPINKIITVPEDGEDDQDTIAKGASCTYFTGGTFRTSEFTDVSSPVFGDFLKTSASGTLTIEATATTETANTVARVEALFNSNSLAKDHRLEFTLITGDG